MALSKELREILVCAFCKSQVEITDERIRCTEPKCGLVYPIRDDIPVMLIDEAERACPSCGEEREWEDDLLRCPGCSEEFRYERG